MSRTDISESSNRSDAASPDSSAVTRPLLSSDLSLEASIRLFKDSVKQFERAHGVCGTPEGILAAEQLIHTAVHFIFFSLLFCLSKPSRSSL
jgi:hypothetical protein